MSSPHEGHSTGRRSFFPDVELVRDVLADQKDRMRGTPHIDAADLNPPHCPLLTTLNISGYVRHHRAPSGPPLQASVLAVQVGTAGIHGRHRRESETMPHGSQAAGLGKDELRAAVMAVSS